MEEGLTRKRRRVYSFKPSRIVLLHRALFSQKYLKSLLPALLEIASQRSSSSNDKEDHEIEKIVRFQVDMALVLSSECRFGWSRALKQKLDQTHMMNSKDCSLHEPTSFLFTYKQNGSSPYCVIKNHNTTHVVPTGLSLACNFPSSAHQKHSKRSKRLVSCRRKREADKLECRLSTLRKILPGGDNMGAYELLSEVESYVVCLELQSLRSVEVMGPSPSAKTKQNCWDDSHKLALRGGVLDECGSHI
ncbi:hypothetical protein BVC80_9081g91 [Macleaya cordata]|uniref:IBH1-like N-terminal domain-containing protein n=1 Tax=Macleaya cordata TaxID=56857 RepID=A0A200PRU5_MACCD|nr:hypothetical protein BVC80_9081g91 [Macleaya cordata]